MNNSIGSPESHMETPVETHHITWRGVDIEINWKPEYIRGVIAHLELKSDGRHPLPMTETGYRSQFVHREDIEEFGWPVAYVEAWLNELDDGKPIQLELF